MEMRDRKGLTEAEFLQQYSRKRYPKPSLTADIAIFSREGGRQYILLVKRKNHPYLGWWALPGGFAEPRESLEETAARELVEETGVSGAALTPVGLFSKPGRDPRGWVVSQAYCALVNREETMPHAGDDAGEAEWFQVSAENGNLTLTGGDGGRPKLAFDHTEIVLAAMRTLQNEQK